MSRGFVTLHATGRYDEGLLIRAACRACFGAALGENLVQFRADDGSCSYV